MIPRYWIDNQNYEFRTMMEIYAEYYVMAFTGCGKNFALAKDNNFKTIQKRKLLRRL